VRDNDKPGDDMTIILRLDQERAIQEAIQAGVIRSVDQFIDTALEALPHGGDAASRQEAVRQMREFGEKYNLDLGEPVPRNLLHEGHRRF
jgi:hypothetical protein